MIDNRAEPLLEAVVRANDQGDDPTDGALAAALGYHRGFVYETLDYLREQRLVESHFAGGAWFHHATDAGRKEVA